jgi:alpha-L-fucosidase
VSRGLKFGVTEHLAASFSWWRGNKGADATGPFAGVPYDGNDPAFADLYHANRGEPDAWLTANPVWPEPWFRRIKDLVDRYHPDLLYSDSGLPFDRVGLALVAHMYNENATRHGGITQAVYTQKDRSPDVYPIGVMDIERGQSDEPTPYVWQTDTSVGDWYYDLKHSYKTPGHVIEMLVDITAKNGCLLLNIPQLPDGTLDDEGRHLLSVLTGWTAVNGEGLYGSRPWTKAAEGPTNLGTPGHFEEKRQAWTTADFRFTAKGASVYAFQMKYPDRRDAFIRALGLTSGLKVAKVSVLGATGAVVWKQLEDGLLVRLPDAPVCAVLPCIKAELAG